MGNQGKRISNVYTGYSVMKGLQLHVGIGENKAVTLKADAHIVS